MHCRDEACCKACNRDLSWQGWRWITHSNCTADLTAEAQQLLRPRHAQPSLTDSLRKMLSITSCGRTFHMETCKLNYAILLQVHQACGYAAHANWYELITCASTPLMLMSSTGVCKKDAASTKTLVTNCRVQTAHYFAANICEQYGFVSCSIKFADCPAGIMHNIRRCTQVCPKGSYQGFSVVPNRKP